MAGRSGRVEAGQQARREGASQRQFCQQEKNKKGGGRRISPCLELRNDQSCAGGSPSRRRRDGEGRSCSESIRLAFLAR